MLVRAALEQSQFDVVEAATGAEAVAVFAERRPQLILLDVVMPEMDGFQACSTIRRLPDGAAVPVLMLTGLDDLDSIRKAYEAGATDFVTKPMNWVILSQRVRYMLRASAATGELAESEARLANAQRIARLGHWEEDLETGEVRWSYEMYRIFGVEPNTFDASHRRVSRARPPRRPGPLGPGPQGSPRRRGAPEPRPPRGAARRDGAGRPRADAAPPRTQRKRRAPRRGRRRTSASASTPRSRSGSSPTSTG